MPVKFLGGVPICFVNHVTNGKGFYISFNPSSSGYGCKTTALVDDDMTKFFILEGDHRKEYSELIEKGFEACFEYFQSNIKLKAKYSDL